MITKLLLALIKIYQKAISPLLPARCRFYPTCSSYALHALTWYSVRGIPLIIKRILRCQPWGGSGVDFVPLILRRHQFTPSKIKRCFVYKDVISYQAFRNHLLNRGW